MQLSQKLQHIGDKLDMFLINNIPRIVHPEDA